MKRKPNHDNRKFRTVEEVHAWLERGGVTYFNRPDVPAMVGVNVEWDEEARMMRLTARQGSMVEGKDTLTATCTMSFPVSVVTLKEVAGRMAEGFYEERREEEN